MQRHQTSFPKVLALAEREFSVGGFSYLCEMLFSILPREKRMDAQTAYKCHSISLSFGIFVSIVADRKRDLNHKCRSRYIIYGAEQKIKRP